jgi:hypothetical protein
MKKFELYKFIHENNVEYHWHENDVILMPNFDEAKEFNELLPASIFDDSGIECIMKDGYLCIYMESICSYCDIEMFDVFPNESNR